jgi:hypothetical protein
MMISDALACALDDPGHTLIHRDSSHCQFMLLGHELVAVSRPDTNGAVVILPVSLTLKEANGGDYCIRKEPRLHLAGESQE